MFTFYEVGGKVRDELMGLKSKDIDYVAVPDEDILKVAHDPAYMFIILEQYLSSQGYDIFLSTRECYTIRARFPAYHEHAGTVADFVMARKEVGYIPGTRTPIVQPGTLLDDLQRRDFTVNAIAKDSTGKLIDPFGGQIDIKKRILRTPLGVSVSFNDDPLRILRAIRFSIIKGFKIPLGMKWAIFNFDYNNKMNVVSTERIREELYKCFIFDTHKTIKILNQYPTLFNYIFDKTNIWLCPTTKQ